MKKFFFLFLFLYAFPTVAFADQKEVMQKVMDSWKGEYIDTVIIEWGYPTDEKNIANKKLYYWTCSSFYVKGNYYNISGGEATCTRILEVNKDNKVVGWEWKGNACASTKKQGKKWVNTQNNLFYKKSGKEVSIEKQEKEIVEPKWEDYVPKKYLSPRYDFRRGSSVVELVSGIVLTDLIFTAPIGIPMIYHSSTKLKNLSYAKKKIIFDEGIRVGSSIKDPQEKYNHYRKLLKKCDFTAERALKVAKQNERDAKKETKRLEKQKQKELKQIEKEKKKALNEQKN